LTVIIGLGGVQRFRRHARLGGQLHADRAARQSSVLSMRVMVSQYAAFVSAPRFAR